MTMNRENRVKTLQNIGQYLIDNAENLIPNEKPYPTKQTFTIELDVEFAIPRLSVETDYHAHETLNGVCWSAK